MVKYYYDKYSVDAKKTYQDTAPWTYSYDTETLIEGLRKNYTFDPATNKYVLGELWGPGVSITDKALIYNAAFDGSFLARYELPAFSGTGDTSHRYQFVKVYTKYADKNAFTTQDVRGSLVQSGIAAEDGTYPIDGKHSDGYWYVKGALANTAPTTPGAFTQPSGVLEIGDSKVFAVGAASDAEGNLSKYIWEASINNGAYSKVGETTTPNLNYTIPAATSLKMRVKAIDSTGLESAYRESSSYSVLSPQFYYDKFTAIATKPKVIQETRGASLEKVSSDLIVKDYLGMLLPGTAIFDSIFLSAEIYNDGISLQGNGGDFTKYPKLYQIYHSGLGGSSDSGEKSFYFYGKYGSTFEFYRMRIVYSSVDYSYNRELFRLDIVEGPTTTYSKGSLMQTGIIGGATTYPSDGRHTDGFWYVKKSRVNQTIAPPTPFIVPISGKKFKPNEVATITFGASNAANISLYEVDYRYNTTGAWTPLAYNNTLSRSLTITTDKTLKTIELRVRVKDTSNVYSDYVYTEAFEIEHNVAPTVTLTNPGDNTTLYESDTLTIGGTAFDADPDQAVTVYYQINAEPRKVLTTNLSKIQIALSKQLIFKAGKIYDGETVLTDTLTAGIEHKLKVWAVDSENASSTLVERTFFVVPNRAPLLSLDAVVPSGVVDVDKFKISGTASDEDANSTVKVTRKINGGDPVEIYSGSGGEWEFDISLAELIVGENTIIIEVIDNYGAKASKTIKLNKNEVKTPILHAVARYKITPPAGSAKGVLLFIVRDEDMDLKVELSMTLAGEQEQYETLTADNTAPMPNTNGIVEDTFYYEATEPKDNIILKISTTRPDATVNHNHKIHLISGAVE